MNINMHKMIRYLLASILALSGLALSGSLALAAPISIDLCASDGTITMPDSTVVNVWGFVLTSSCASGLVNDTNFTGALLDVTAGDVVTINLSSALPAGHTASFELSGLPVNNPVPGQYVFTASRPGTFSYQSAADSGRQAAMGLYGALIVRPLTAGQAYDDPSSAYDVESTLVLSEVDPNFNAAPDTFDMNNYLATYWLINGKAYPGTAPIAAGGNDAVLLRYVNTGYDNTSMMLLGLHEHVIARDAYPLSHPFDAAVETVPAGGTEDVLVNPASSFASSANGFPLFNRNLHVTNGTACVSLNPCAANPAFTPGGMMTFILP